MAPQAIQTKLVYKFSDQDLNRRWRASCDLSISFDEAEKYTVRHGNDAGDGAVMP